MRILRPEDNTVALAKTAQAHDAPLVVTNGSDTGPSGPLSTPLKAVQGDTEVIVRGGNSDAFDTPRFVEAAGREELVPSGLMTEGRVLQTAPSGVDRGCDVHVAVDVTAGVDLEVHDAAVQRTVQAGAVPVTRLSGASEFQRSCDDVAKVGHVTGLVSAHPSTLGMFVQAGAAAAATRAAAADD